MTTVPRAQAIAAAALAVLPNLTADGLGEGVPLTDPRALREVAAAAEWLAEATPVAAFLRRSSTSILAELAADRAGLNEVGSGAMLAAAVALGIAWQPIPNTPHVLLAVSPHPGWRKPTPEAAVQAARRLGGAAAEGDLRVTIMETCSGRGRRPPPQLVSAAIEAAVADGRLVRADGQVRVA